MPNPNIPQGTINRLRASAIYPAAPGLNVTSGFLGKEGIRLAFDGNSITYIDTMTGAVPSPEPYIKVTATLHLLKSQPLSDSYKSRMETLATVGPMTIRPDAATLSPYLLVNCGIQSIRELDFSGADAGFAVMIGGYYNINGSLFS